MKRTLPCLITILLFVNIASAQVEKRCYIEDENWAPREHNVDFKKMVLRVEFEPEKKLVKGHVKHSFTTLQKNVDSLFVDGIDLTVHAVKLDGKKADYRNEKNGISVFSGSPMNWYSDHELEIEYEATPESGIYFIGWNDTLNKSRKQIWTQGQGIENRHWIPFYDEMNDKLVTEMIVTFDSDYKVLSNGEFLGKKELKGGKTKWHYKMQHPHAPYLTMLGIGKYKVKKMKSESGVPMDLWYYPEWEDRFEWTYKYSKEMMDFFENEIGVPYPWENYSQIPVQDFMYGAMENTTSTLFGDFYFVDERGYLDRNYVAVNAHELAHQWFGDLVTARSSRHHWLQESFATHYNWLYEREAFGQDHYDWNRRRAVKASLRASEEDYKPIAHSGAGSVRHYPKGAHVLHMLKYVAGRDEYNKSVKHYLEKHAYDNVDSEDLMVAFHETLGLNLDWFWEEWVYHGGEPHYQVSFSELKKDGKRYGEFRVEQVHETNDVVGLFKMPVFFEIHYSDNDMERKKVWVEEKGQVISMPLAEGKKVEYVLFDPNSQVMKKVDFEKPVSMLKAQAQKAEHMLDRYDALRAMKDIPLEEKRDLLIDVFNEDDEFHSVKEEVISQLGEDDNENSIELIKSAINSEDVDVRKAVIAHIEPDDKILPEYEKLLNDKSYNVVEGTLAKLALHYPGNLDRYLEMTKEDTGIVGRNVKVIWLEIAYSHTGKQEYADQLVDFTSRSYEFRTRVNAARALQRLNYLDKEGLKYMITAVRNPNGRLAKPVKEVLGHFYDKDEYKKLIYDYIVANDWGKDEAAVKAILR